MAIEYRRKPSAKYHSKQVIAETDPPEFVGTVDTEATCQLSIVADPSDGIVAPFEAATRLDSSVGLSVLSAGIPDSTVPGV